MGDGAGSPACRAWQRAGMPAVWPLGRGARMVFMGPSLFFAPPPCILEAEAAFFRREFGEKRGEVE